MSTNRELKSGTKLLQGKYRIVSVLGQGSFGITYLATTKFTVEGNLGPMSVEGQVAIKEFFMSEVNSRKDDGSSVEGSTGNVFSNYRKKFRKEAENLSRLSNEGIVKVYDVFDENNTTYYAMEFLQGCNLDDYIRQNGAIPEKEAIAIIKEVGRSLAYMHDRKMLHLDIKPKNIMRRTDGTFSLIDFGLSKQFTDDGEPESSTSIGLGTPGYAPIEQSGYKQDGTFPATLDVYALGATLFKMLTGRRPPEATIVLNDGFPDEELRKRQLSDGVIGALKKAMEPVKKNRYQDVGSFIEGLEEERTLVVDVLKPEKKPEKKKTVKEEERKPEKKEEKKEARKEEKKEGKKESRQEVKKAPEKILEPVVEFEKAIKKEPKKPEVNPKPKPEPKPKPNNKKFMLFGGAAILVVAVSAGAFLIPNSGESAKEVVVDSLAADSVKAGNSLPAALTNAEWVSPLGKSLYTGEVDDKSLPHGKGVAKITEGQYAGSIYDGNFVHGKMEGQTTYTLKNGDTFKGEFRDNMYSRGRYTMKATGEYFEGSFSNGEPANGNWYNKNGQKLAN